MAMSAEEVRVLASLIEKEATVPDSYPMSLNALRLACNQTTNRAPVVAYEDRTVEAALLSLKSIGLVRFVLPSHGGRTIRYRHVADERWRLSPEELVVLAVLALRGPQTVSEVRSRAERVRHFDAPSAVDEALDALAGRSPEALATRLPRRSGERDQRWADLLTGAPPDDAPQGRDARAPTAGDVDAPAEAPEPPVADGTDLAAEVSELRRRLDRLEQLLGVEDG